MRILVMSDTHGRLDTICAAVRREGNVQLIVHLGDGAADMQHTLSVLDGKPLLQVRGNCDLAVDLPEQIVTKEGGKTLLCTHGHRQYVKYGEQKLIEEARKVHADIALYGHTHVPVQHYEDGLYVCNPGPLMMGHYAVLEITPQGIMWLAKRI